MKDNRKRAQLCSASVNCWLQFLNKLVGFPAAWGDCGHVLRWSYCTACDPELQISVEHSSSSCMAAHLHTSVPALVAWLESFWFAAFSRCWDTLLIGSVLPQRCYEVISGCEGRKKEAISNNQDLVVFQSSSSRQEVRTFLLFQLRML